MKNLKILCLNCQKAYHPNIEEFLRGMLKSDFYDFLLLQEADDKILQMIQGIGSYKLLGAFNQGAHTQSHLCILYRDIFILKNSSFLSFSAMERRFALRGEPGFLIGVFNCGGKLAVVGSLHLRPGFPFRLRMREMAMVKKHILCYTNSELPLVFGGDLNLGFPWEGSNVRKLLAPDFLDATITIGPTLNSLYTEKGTHPVSKIANFLQRFSISLKFKTDRLFVDKITGGKYKIISRVLPDRVSDHSPVELILIML